MTGAAPLEELTRPNSPAGEEVVAPRRTVWRRFRRHRLAMVSLAVLGLGYFVAVFAGFFAPTTAGSYNGQYAYAPPQRVHLLNTSGGHTDFGPYTYGYRARTDPKTYERSFRLDRAHRIPLGFFVHGRRYRILGLIGSDIHFFGPRQRGDAFFPLGANSKGQDVLSRTLVGAQISLSIGLVGVALSFVFGVVVGGLSGYCGGWMDTVVQRVIELVLSVPTIPLWMGLSAALPPSWSTTETYFGMTIILSLIGWTGLARVVRGQFLALRGEDYVTAARLDGVRRRRIIARHLLPACSGYLVAALTLAIPRMILGETTLSFLGLGLQPPAVSWGVLLQEGQSLRTLETAPWLLLPGLAVVVVALAFNFVGDGVRDAADPHAR